MKMNESFRKIIFFIKSLIVPLGLQRIYKCNTSKQDLSEMMEKISSELVKSENIYAQIFVRNITYHKLNRFHLQNLRAGNLTQKLVSTVVSIIQFLFYILDFSKFIISGFSTFYCMQQIHSSSRNSQKAYFYSFGRKRAQFYRELPELVVGDVLVDIRKHNGYSITHKLKFNHFYIIKYARLKLEFYYVNSNAFRYCIASYILYQRFFETESPIKGTKAFSREGTTPNSKVFLQAAKDYGLKPCVMYTTTVLNDSIIIPGMAENIYTLSKFKIPKHNANQQIINLGDQPFIPWREIAALEKSELIIGVLMGNDWDRWPEQNVLDEGILEKLLQFHNVKILVRPHPQEFSRRHRNQYYEELVSKHKGAELSSEPVEDFLRKITILITYCRSSVVLDAMICRIPVVEISPENFFPNFELDGLSKVLHRRCSSFGEIRSNCEALIHERNSELSQSDWELVIEKLGFLPDSRVDLSRYIIDG